MKGTLCILGLAALMLSGCGQTPSPASSAAERGQGAESGVFLRENGADALDMVLVENGSTTVLRTLTQGEAYDDAAAVSVEPFSDVLGCSGVILRVAYPSGWSSNTYEAVENGALRTIAESFGPHPPDDTAVDLDGDGTAEFICNVTFNGDGVEDAHVYQLHTDGVARASARDLMDADYENTGASSLSAKYDAEQGVFLLGYTPLGQDTWQSFAYAPDLTKLHFTTYSPLDAA